MVTELTKVSVYNLEGQEVGSVDLPVFNIDEEYAKGIVSDVAIMYEANRKRHTGHAKTGGEVHHSTRKLYRQKGTGRARAGMSSSPVRVGGGVAFPPRYRVVKNKINRKLKKKALLLGIILKFLKNKFKVLEKIDVENTKTKNVAGFLKNLKLKSSLFVLEKDNEKFYISARNLPKTGVMRYSDLNVYDVLRYDNLIITKEVFDDLVKKCEQEVEKINEKRNTKSQ